jgi:hypothetical protein
MTCGDAEALPNREAGSRAIGCVAALEHSDARSGAVEHVTAPEPSLVGRWGLEPRNTQRLMVACSTGCLIFMSVVGVPCLQGTDSDPKPTSGEVANLQVGPSFWCSAWLS